MNISVQKLTKYGFSHIIVPVVVIVLVGVIGIATLLMSHAATCTTKPTAHGSPGIRSFTLHIDQDKCHLKTRAAIICDPEDTGQYYGEVRTNPGKTSTATCPFGNVKIIAWAYQYSTDNGKTYKVVQLGHSFL